MNTISNWNPLRELESMQDRILRAMHLGTPSTPESRQALSTIQWTPTIDIVEDEHEYLVKVEIPEVSKDDVKVTVENGLLSIRGERKFEKEDKHKTYHRIERCYGSFSRSLSLPDDADPNQVTAEFKDGLLRVRLGKSEAKKPKQIEVLVN